MKFRVLGPLEVRTSRGPIGLGGPKQRLVLALLLTDLGRLVSTDRLIDALWGESPPETARNTLQSYVSNLRRALGDPGSIEGRDGGYLLVVDEEEVDSTVFAHMLEQSQPALERDPAAGLQRLQEALALWRGEPYEDLAYEEALQAEIRRLNELRLGAIESRIDAQLAAGSYAELLAELQDLTARHRGRERFWGQLMEALYRSGRQAEALRAYQRARAALAEELGIEPGPELRRLEERILQQDPTLLGGRARASNPFKGLRSFTEADADLFFGRRHFTERLVARLSERGLRGRLVVLTGPSGSGKTSVVRAGLIPQLASGSLDGPDQWEIITTFPGTDPYRQLASSLLQSGARRPNRSAPAAPIHRLQQGADETTLLFVDQFEELWTLVEDREIRRSYLDDLTELARQGPGPRVLVAIRSDFLDRLVADPAAAPILDDVLLVLPPLTDAELATAVTEPAQTAGLALDADVVAQIVHDAGGRAGALPLVQYAMTELFDRAEQDIVTVSAYEAVGGLSGALSRRAEDVFLGLPDGVQQTARDVFLRLVTLTEEGEIAKQRARRDEIAELADEPKAVSRVLEEFGRHRFLVFDRDPDGYPTVDVAHESLLHEWSRFRSWIDTRADDLRTRARLATAAAEWRESGGDESYLLTGRRLAEFDGWSEATDLSLTNAEASILADSREARDTSKRRAARLRWTVISLLAVAAAVAGIFAFVASTQRDRAQEARDLSNAERLAAAAAAQVGEDPQLALLLAVEAAEAFAGLEEPGSGLLLDVLHDAIGANRALATLDAGGFVSYSPDGDRIAALVGIAGAGTTIDEGAEVGVFEASTGRRLRTLSLDGRNIGDLTYGGSPAMIAATSFDPASPSLDGRVTVWDESGTVVAELAVPEGVPDNPTFGGAGHFSVNVVDLAGTGQWLHTAVFDTSDWSERFRVALDAFGGVAFDDAGELLAIPQGSRGIVELVDVATGEAVGELEHGPFPIGAAFDPEGGRLATVSLEPPGVLNVWDLASRRVVASATTPAAVLSLAWSPDGASLATAGPDGVITLWDPNTASELATLRGHRGGLNAVRSSISYHPSGKRLASADLQSTIIWRAEREPAAEVQSVDAHDVTESSETAVFADAATVVSGSARELARIDLASGRRVWSTQLVSDPAVEFFITSPDGRLAATFDVRGNRPPELVAAETGDTLRVLDAGGNPVAFDDAGDLLLTGGPTPTEPGIVFDTATGAVVMRTPIADEDQSVEVAAFDAEGRRLAVGHSSGVVTVWDVASGDQLGVLEHLGFITAIEFDTDGRRLAAADVSGVIDVWDVAAMAQGVAGEELLIREFAFPAGHALSVGFAPDGDLVASGFTERVTAWDVTTGAERYDVATGAPGWSIDFAPGGAHMVVPGPEGTIRIYATSADELVSIARSRLVRGFTVEECARFRLDPCPGAAETAG